MDKGERNIDVIKAEQEDFYSNDDIFRINSWGADLSFRELITQYKEGDLLKPELQRNYVWEKPEASRFIDSILLGLPVPSIFLAKTPDERTLIIDGYQRIMTVHDYVEGIFSKDGKIFKLTNTGRINKRWRGKAFSELTDAEHRKIRNTTIHCIIFIQRYPEDDDTSMYQIFERINTTGHPFLPQEIRNCVYQGSFNDLLFKLNEVPSWRALYGLQKPDSRMRDMEFILRFFALGSQKLYEHTSGQVSLKQFQNEFMGFKHTKESLKQMERQFRKVVAFIHDCLGEEAFHNISPRDPNKFVKKFNPTIFDSIMIATQFALQKKKLTKTKEVYKARRLELLQDQDYQDLIRVRTTDVEKIKRRISLAAKYLYGDDCE